MHKICLKSLCHDILRYFDKGNQKLMLYKGGQNHKRDIINHKGTDKWSRMEYIVTEYKNKIDKFSYTVLSSNPFNRNIALLT